MLHSKDIEWLNGYKNKTCGTSLVVQWLRLCTSNAGRTGSFPGSGTKIPHASWCGQKKQQQNKTRPVYINYLQGTQFRSKDTQTESEGREKGIPCKLKWKKARVVILILDKTDLKIKTVTRSKEGHYVMIERSIQRARRVARPGGTEVPCPFPAHRPRQLFHLAIPVLHLLAEKKSAQLKSCEFSFIWSKGRLQPWRQLLT